MQGSEDNVIIYLVTTTTYGNVIQTLYREELYTVATRGRKRLILVAGRDETDGLNEIKTILRRLSERRRNYLGELIPWEPIVKNTAKDADVKPKLSDLRPPVKVKPEPVLSDDDIEMVDFDD
jgi:hypothetical protein